MWIFAGLAGFLVSGALIGWGHVRARWSGKAHRTAAGALYLFQYKGATKSRPARLRIGVRQTMPYRFLLRHEKRIDRLCKALGISEEIQVGDTEFDESIYIVSDDQLFGRQLQSSEALRARILELFRLGVTAIQSNGHKLWIEQQPAPFKEPGQAPEAVTAIVAILNDIIPELKRLEVHLGQRVRDPVVWQSATLLGLSTASAIVGLVFWGILEAKPATVIVDQKRFFYFGLKASMPFLIGFFVWAVAWIHRTSRAHLVFLELLLTAGFGIPACTLLAAREINMEWDRGTVREHPVGLRESYTRITRSRSSSTTHFHLVVDSWRHPGAAENLEVSREVYEAINGRPEIIVATRPGYLRFEWVSEIR